MIIHGFLFCLKLYFLLNFTLEKSKSKIVEGTSTGSRACVSSTLATFGDEGVAFLCLERVPVVVDLIDQAFRITPVARCDVERAGCGEGSLA